ncbi:hypothetical protein Tco_0584544 [Tanacetum coccineum]
MFFYLTTLNLARFLNETAPQVEPPKEGQPSNAQAMQAVETWKHSDFLCHNYVLNGLVDSFTLENTSFAHRASTSANPNPIISPAFVEAKSLNSSKRLTKGGYVMKDLRTERQERVVGFEEAPNKEGSRGGRNAKGIRILEIEAREDGNRGVNLPPLPVAHLGRNGGGQPLRSSLTSVH